jgi:hypothetical protein
MKTLFFACTLVELLAANAHARPKSAPQPAFSYDCGPNEYDSSGAPVAHRCY